MLFADLLSLHLATFLMFFILVLLEITTLLIVKRSSVTSGIEVVLWTLLNSGIIQIYLSALDIHS